MGIEITDKGLNHIKEKLKKHAAAGPFLIGVLESNITQHPLKLSQLQEQFEDITALEPNTETKIPGLKIKYGRYHDDYYFYEKLSKDGSVVKGWHMTVLQQIRASVQQVPRALSEIVFQVGQDIINGKQDGYRK